MKSFLRSLYQSSVIMRCIHVSLKSCNHAISAEGREGVHMATMLYQGHGSYRFVLDGGLVVYVDPFAGDGYDMPADVVLCTHEHFDHTAVDKMPKNDACIVLRSADFQKARAKGEVLCPHGVRIELVQASNANHPIDECFGLLLHFDGVSFYAAGDTSTTEDMSSGRLAAASIDYAVFPCDGVYNMDVDEASSCAALVAARHSIPVHMVPMSGEPTSNQLFSEEVAAQFSGPGKIVLQPGEELGLTPVE